MNQFTLSRRILTNWVLISTLLLTVLLLSFRKPVSWSKAVIDIDLTKGAPTDKRLTIDGGEWANGWRVTGDFDRILIDAGHDIQNGYFEVVVTRRGGITFTERKRNWMGLFACPDMNQCPGGYARGSAEGYGFSKAEIFAATQPNTICEQKFGQFADWVLDDQTEHRVRAEIRNGVMTWSNQVGNQRSETACGDAAKPVTQFRYATVGGILREKKGWHHGSLVGLRVLRATIVDYGKTN